MRINAGELEVSISFEEEGDREDFVEMLVEFFSESEYLLSDIATNDGGRFVDLYVETAHQDGYIEIAPFLEWLEGTVIGIAEMEEIAVDTG